MDFEVYWFFHLKLIHKFNKLAEIAVKLRSGINQSKIGILKFSHFYPIRLVNDYLKADLFLTEGEFVTRKLKKLKRPYWNLVSKCPKFIRQKIIRSRFEIVYELDPQIIFKQATSKDEIEQALALVYNAYIHLNYIDENSDQLHLNKYLTLPTTTILVIKKNDEVIGTMSIILDSSLGLPTETTWTIDEFRKKGQNIAEISALTIKKDFKGNKGQLLLPLCKLMFSFCLNILNLNTIVIATTFEVEFFYIDLLLFKKISDSHGQKHDLVKGNKSSCCYLEIGDEFRIECFKTYAHKELKSNYYYYFYSYLHPNIQLPAKLITIQAQLKEKNFGMIQILKEKPHLFNKFNSRDKLVISNLESSGKLADLTDRSVCDRKNPRLVTMLDCRVKKPLLFGQFPAKIVEISFSGLKVKLLQKNVDFRFNDEITIKIKQKMNFYSFTAIVMWVENNQEFGCMVQTESLNYWHQVYMEAWGEYQETDQESVEIAKVA